VVFFGGVSAKRLPETPSAAEADAAPNELTRALARNVMAARAETGMSQRALAARAGMARAYLARIEQGNANVGLGMLMILARALGKEPADLIRTMPADRAQPKKR
jgi:ribosome-binding protein aMBF1 (putative translation factor)